MVVGGGQSPDEQTPGKESSGGAWAGKRARGPRQAFWDGDTWDGARTAGGKDNSAGAAGGGGQEGHRKDKQRP